MSRCQQALLAAGIVWVVAAGGGIALPTLTEIPTAYGHDTPSPANGLSALKRRDAVVAVYEKVKRSIVNLHSERTIIPASDDLFRLPVQPQRVNGMGTGIVLDPRGYILTNFHVVDDVHTLRARLHDGGNFPARVLAIDKQADLAVIKIEPPQPLPLPVWGTSSDLMVGEAVIAIGNAYGYEHSITDGRVSYIGRDVSLNKEMGYKGLIQTSAPINPGNSGGPLLNVLGEIVGVNVAIRAGAQNIAFALPADQVIPRAAELLSRRRHGLSHGMVLRDVAERDDPDGPARRRVVVEAVETDSPAHAAGVKAGDILETIADVPIRTTIDSERALLERGIGAALPLRVRRDRQSMTLTLTLAAKGAAPAAAELIWRKLGVRLVPVTAESVRKAHPQLQGGLRVVEVAPQGTAGVAGIVRGDILVGLHTWETLSHDNVLYVLNHKDFASFLPLKYYIVRDNTLREGWIPALP